MHVLGLDIGSNSVGSAWVDLRKGTITAGVSVFPAGVDEADDKRGEPKNAKRRMTRRTRITLARRAHRKRELRRQLIEYGLLPGTEEEYLELLQRTDPWELRSAGVTQSLEPFEFGRVLLHLAQRRGALGLRLPDLDVEEGGEDGSRDDGKVKASIQLVQQEMRARGARTFGQLIHMLRSERVTPISTKDLRPAGRRLGRREWRFPVRNRRDSYEHCADRAMIRSEFALLWDRQLELGGATARLLTPELRLALDDERGDAVWRHKGLLFGQRRQTWDLGTLGRCDLHPEERCVPHADMYASRYLVVETVNNLRVLENGRGARPLTPAERRRVLDYLSGPLGTEKPRGGRKGSAASTADRPKRTVSVTDLRLLMGSSKDGWGRSSKSARFRFNIENDEDRTINTDWFRREIVCGAVTVERWEGLSERTREGLNRAILKYDPDHDEDARKLRDGVRTWGELTYAEADALVAAWRSRPRPDAKRLNMGRRAVRNLLTVMDREEPWQDPQRPGQHRWLTQIEARKLLAGDADFLDVTTGKPLEDVSRRRYATGAKGATARDRYYMRKHVLKKDGKPVIDGDTGEPLAEPPPAPLITNPVVRKAIHEVRRHLVEYMREFGRKPDQVYVELAREARMSKLQADRALTRNRLRNRIRRSIVEDFCLGDRTSTQQRAAVDRIVLAVQQGHKCPLCGVAGLTERRAAAGDACEIAHILPRASGGHNGFSNTVLAHTKCNRDMNRRTPRELWSDGPGFEEAMVWVRGIYRGRKRPTWAEARSATGNALWEAYFDQRDDEAKIERFSMTIEDIRGMTERQEAATKYATRQVMAYLDDALYGGKGLPERSTPGDGYESRRRIFASSGLWTSRMRREWGLFFDPHQRRAHAVEGEERQLRKEKDRGDHRHHPIDAVAIALCTAQVQNAWEEREKRADLERVNTADEEAMDDFRRRNPIPPPVPFRSAEDLRAAVKRAVFGDGQDARPVCHRPVKRKLVGALHEETLLGPIINGTGEMTDGFTARKSVLELNPKHLRMPHKETEEEAIERISAQRRAAGDSARAARMWATEFVRSPAFSSMRRRTVDASPGKSGIVRDVALRGRLRECIRMANVDPDQFTKGQIKKLSEEGRIQHASGVPIRSVVLLRTMRDPVVVKRRRPEYSAGRMAHDSALGSVRAYQGGNNHHIEIRVDEQGGWSGRVVTAFEAAERNVARLRALRQNGIPKPTAFRLLSRHERDRLGPILKAVEAAHPIINRRDDPGLGGRFVMSLCEGEVLHMRHKSSGEVGWFVVAKLDKPNGIVLVPHWDARPASGRKDADGMPVAWSGREDFTISPAELKRLAPPGRDHAEKVRVSPLGRVTRLQGD